MCLVPQASGGRSVGICCMNKALGWSQYTKSFGDVGLTQQVFRAETGRNGVILTPLAVGSDLLS